MIPEVVTVATAEAAAAADLGGRSVLVLDVLRASTTLCRAFENGAAEAWPAADVPAALRWADELSHAGVLLCGERGGLPIPGFDLGNSPSEYSAERVSGRPLVFASTNGSRALLAARGAARVGIAGLVNARAAASWAVRGGGPLALLCAGREGEESPEDLIGAGAVLRRVLALTPGVRMDALSKRAMDLRRRADEPGLAAALLSTPHGRYLASLGFERDIAACAEEDALDVVPELQEGRIVAARRAPVWP